MTDVALALGEVTLRATVTGTGPTVLLLHTRAASIAGSGHRSRRG